jgi:serine/threonine protein kinase
VPIASQTQLPQSSDPLIGARIEGRYTIEAVHGRGGMGVVYAGLHRERGHAVAIKVLDGTWARDPLAVELFLLEAQTASALSHPNIVAVLDLGLLPNGRPYLVMPMIVGHDLSTLLLREGPQPPQRIATLLRGVASALDLIHEKGLVHRDIKSENLMHVRHDDGAESVLVLDFGIASARLPRSQQQHGPWCGTPEFMPPEALAGEPTDHRGDVYALATVAFELITGCLPFDSDDLGELIRRKREERPRTLAEVSDHSFPAELEAVIARGLASQPEARFGSASELVAALAAAATAVTDGAPSPKAPQRVARNHTLLGTGAALAAAQPRANTPTPTGVHARRQTRRDFHVAQAARETLEPTAERAQTLAGPASDPVRSIGPAALARKLAQASRSASARPAPLQAPAVQHEPEQPPDTAPMPEIEPSDVPLQRSAEAPPPADVTWPHTALYAAAEDSAQTPLRSRSLARRLWYGGVAALAALTIVLWGRARPTDRSPARPSIAAEPSLRAPVAAANVATPPNEPAAPEPAANAAHAEPGSALPTAEPSPVSPPLESTAALAPRGEVDRARRAGPRARPTDRVKSGPDRRPAAKSPVLSARSTASEPRVRSVPPATSTDSRVAKSRSARVEAVTQAATDAMLGGQLETAATLYDQAVKLDAGYAPAWRGKGLLLERAGRRREAAAAFLEFLRLQPTGPAAEAIRRRLSALELKP